MSDSKAWMPVRQFKQACQEPDRCHEMCATAQLENAYIGAEPARGKCVWRARSTCPLQDRMLGNDALRTGPHSGSGT